MMSLKDVSLIICLIGDMEKLRLNTQPIAMMDRERKDELPQMQGTFHANETRSLFIYVFPVNFIDVVCRPLYMSLSESFPWIRPLLDGCLSNREKWADLAEKGCYISTYSFV